MRLGNVNVQEGVDMEVESSVRHPEYEDGRYVNDIAVIKMKGQVSINGNERFLLLSSHSFTFGINLSTHTPLRIKCKRIV